MGDYAMIEVVHEVGVTDLRFVERCCFCREPTRYWFLPKDVACCEECASKAEPADVPDKDAWCRRERVARKEC